MRQFLSRISLTALLVLAAIPARAENAGIVIQDSGGIPRGSSPVEGLGRVDFAVVDAAGQPAEGAVVTLTNTVTGETLTASSVSGMVSFDNIAAGTWTVASSSPGLTFTNVSILAVSAGAAGTTLAAGTALGIIGTGGAATAVGFGIHDVTSGKNNSTDLSPSS